MRGDSVNAKGRVVRGAYCSKPNNSESRLYDELEAQLEMLSASSHSISSVLSGGEIAFKFMTKANIKVRSLTGRYCCSLKWTSQ